MDKQETSMPTLSLFVDVILPIPLPQLFTYRVPIAIQPIIKKGCRVIVPFGEKKFHTGIVINLHSSIESKAYTIKYISDLISHTPVVGEKQLEFYSWLEKYYMSTPGEVIHAALPSNLLISSQSMVQLHPTFNETMNVYSLSDKEQKVLQLLKKGDATYKEISQLLATQNIHNTLKSLSQKKTILLYENVKEKYQPKKEKRVRLAPAYTSPNKMKKLFKQLKAKPRQETLLLSYLDKVAVLSDSTLNDKGIQMSALTENGRFASSLTKLITQGVMDIFLSEIPRYKAINSINKPLNIELNEAQKSAFQAICKEFKKKKPVLLHGITGSGKTEVYISLIKEALARGHQVLMLVPEIALTTQIVERLRLSIGTPLDVYHSKFSNNERTETWNNVLSGNCSFVIGARSSIFLPFSRLRFIIVDEEHDPSYKQQDPAPRYHARDAALMMATIHHADIILGSATPSTESFFHAMHNKYTLVALKKRYGKAQLPSIQIADMRKHSHQQNNTSPFSTLLLKTIEKVLENQGQAIIFQNRRGYSPMIQCTHCEWSPTCIQCAVHLVYHQKRQQLSCHYCGYNTTLPVACPSCQSKQILTKGYGTEQLEEELKLHFPSTSVKRMDKDTTNNKRRYQSLLKDFESRKIQILVGTQMITKGLDFGWVQATGIFDADRMMCFPDFRSHERTFQLIVQAGGRAGRREKAGIVIIQTKQPHQELFQYVIDNNVEEFIQLQLKDRQANHYPPYTRLIEVVVKHRHQSRCKSLALTLAQEFARTTHHIEVLGPSEPVIAKIKNEFIMTILLKIRRNVHQLKDIKKQCYDTTTRISTSSIYRSAKVIFNVDPV